MAVGTSVKFDARDAQRRLARLGTRLKSEDILEGVANRVLAWVDENFRRRGIERPWRPLSPNTIAARRKGSSAPLQDTGRLKQSFTITRRAPRLIEVGTNVTYAEFHEEGTDPYTIRPRRASVLRFTTADGVRFARSVRHPGLPQRKMLPTTREANRLAKVLLEARMAAAASEANRG